MSQAENRNTTIPTRRAVFAGAPAAAALAAGAATGGIATALAAPRTGAAIEFYKLQLDELDEDIPLETLVRCDDTLWDVLTVEPTTMAGVVAVLEHVGHHEFLDDDAPGEDSLENTVLSAPIHGEGEFKQAAQDFPQPLAVIIRSIFAHGDGGGVG